MPKVGQTIFHYRILEKIGVGGMGEVYLADDLSLDRKVALKFLPDVFTGDPERMARFEREAKLLASLNHPNIAAIYGLEQADGKRFLIMEYVEGETLQARISKGAFPLEDALAFCRQIAEGLEAAHEKGVIHRDLKPANVMITGEEKVKILDFGLAKALLGEGQSVDSSQSPTITEAMTQPGVVLGTAAYMSPEQAKGKTVDKRSDIWAFGCILYECLTGKKAFEGETVTETLAAVIRGDPDWNILPITTPQNIRFALSHCLEKDKARRFQSAVDVQILIAENGTPSSRVEGVSSRTGWKRATILGLVALAIALFGLAIGWMAKPSPTLPPRTPFSLPNVAEIYSPLAGQGYYRQFALSSDGQKLAFVYSGEDKPLLAVRQFDSIDIKILDNTDGATMPFWSPKDESIAFFDGAVLKRITLATGSIEPICESLIFMGGSWGANDEIVFAGFDGLWHVPASGGTPQLIVEGTESETWAFPSFFYNGRRFLCSHWTRDKGWTIEAFTIGDDISQPLIKAHVAEVVGNNIVFLRPDGLFYQPFDSKTTKLKGTETRLDAGDDSQGHLVGYALSETGTLVYQRRTPARLQWFDRNGESGEVLKLNLNCRSPDISPNGKMLVVECIEPDVSPIDVIAPRDILTYDLERNSPLPITKNGGDESDPVWSRDGTEIFFSSNVWDGKGANIYRTDPSGNEFECVLDAPGNQWVMGWWPGKNLVYVNSESESLHGLFMLEESKPKQLVLGSADGQLFSEHLLYSYQESGETQVYVQSLKDSSKTNISIQGGHKPRWRPDGKEIFYLSPNRTLMAVPVSWDGGFKPGKPMELFKTGIATPRGSGMRNPFAVTEDGQRFLMYVGDSSSSLTIVFNAFIP